ncbi:MAG: hypothetical protein EZS28_032412 [Streblomastix strix]|uniref:Uncharacterized protein n=1 Tax=Streblomastix strix TaxID=222440 RepID=A0A5J4UPU0_9EUKA|nr:MAG: hypothetical protein EZS28_032412 [Streblomastix strix]
MASQRKKEAFQHKIEAAQHKMREKDIIKDISVQEIRKQLEIVIDIILSQMMKDIPDENDKVMFNICNEPGRIGIQKAFEPQQMKVISPLVESIAPYKLNGQNAMQIISDNLSASN